MQNLQYLLHIVLFLADQLKQHEKFHDYIPEHVNQNTDMILLQTLDLCGIEQRSRNFLQHRQHRYARVQKYLDKLLF